MIGFFIIPTSYFWKVKYEKGCQYDCIFNDKTSRLVEIMILIIIKINKDVNNGYINYH